MATQYILNMRASKVVLMLVKSLTALMIRACRVGVCVILSSGSTFSR